jgi:hypothetical protein
VLNVGIRFLAVGALGHVGEHAIGGFGCSAAHDALEFFIDERLHCSKLILQLATLILKGGDLFVDALNRGHASMRLLEKADCRGSLLRSGKIFGRHCETPLYGRAVK